MKQFALLFTALIFSQGTKAGSLLGADLQYAHVEGLTWSFTVITYVDPNGPADFPGLLFSMDGGNVDTIPRESQTLLTGDCLSQIWRDVYTWQWTFSGPGIYSLKAWKGTRINTVNLPDVPDNALCLSTTLIIDPGMVNSSPVFGAPQRTTYYYGNTLVHDPMVTDPDGDSLTFSPDVPAGEDCYTIGTYLGPELSTPDGDFTLLDPATGVFRWVQPNTSGMFNVVMRCWEWRDGIVIGSVKRNMTICVQAPFTSIEETDPNDARILQPSLDGPVTVCWNNDRGYLIDILNMRGSLVQHVRGMGPRTVLATDQMTPGIYLVRAIDVHGAITAGRFVVAR